MKIGVLEKNNSRNVFTFNAKTFRIHKDYTLDQYAHYIVEENTDERAYYWDDESQSVLFNADYIEPSNPIEIIAKDAVTNARIFGSNILNDFASENVALGITQAGKTADILSVMEKQIEIDAVNKPGVKISVMGTITSGSLYESITVINKHIEFANNGDYDHLSPYITPERLTNFKNKIQNYLGL